MTYPSPYIQDLPHLVDPGPGPGPGYIPPPNGASFEPGIHSAFPGFSSPSPWGQPQGAWAAPGSPPQWGAAPQNNQFGGGFSGSYFDQPVTATPWFGGGGGAVARSNSFGGSSPYHELKRSHSLGSNSPSPWHAKGGPIAHRDDAYNEHNLARRPRDWRGDYTPHPGVFGGLRQKFSRVDTEIKEIPDRVKRKIHPFLNFNAAPTGLPPIYAHVLSPFTTLSLPAFNRAPNQLDFLQLASDPPTQFIRITHPSLPWYIDVQNTQPNGITIADILAQIAEALSRPISARHFWNEALSASDRAALTQVFKNRCGDDMAEVSRGVKQVDFLGGAVWLMGFVRQKSGMWEMITEKTANQ